MNVSHQAQIGRCSLYACRRAISLLGQSGNHCCSQIIDVMRPVQSQDGDSFVRKPSFMPRPIAAREFGIIVPRRPLVERNMYVVHIATGHDPVAETIFFARQQTFQPNRRRCVDKHDQIDIIDERISPTIKGTCQNPPRSPLCLTDEADSLFRRAFCGERRARGHPIVIIDVQMLDSELMCQPPAQSRHACARGSCDVNAIDRLHSRR